MTLLIVISTSSSARAVNSKFGPRSKETIEIKVSVAPRFVATSASDLPSRGIEITSVAPSLRFHVVVNNPQPTDTNRHDTLYLIVPD